MRNTTVDVDTDEIMFATSSLHEWSISACLSGGEDDPTARVSLTRKPRFQPARGVTCWQSNVARSLVTATTFALTAPITVQSTNYTLSQSEASSLECYKPSKRGRRVSWREACRLAQQILAETERAICDGRRAEARRLSFIWEDSDQL
jgi:hypothetical protein